jgi:ABC exporter DevB family membrane fusion protein
MIAMEPPPGRKGRTVCHDRGRRVVATALASIAVVICLGMNPRQDPDGEAAAAPIGPAKTGARGASRSVRALARLEPVAGLVAVGARPGARILSIEVAEADRVRAGQNLASLEGGDVARHQLEGLEAKKKAALSARDRQRRLAALENERTDAVQKVRLDMAEKSYRALEAQVKRLTDVTKALPPTTSLSDRTSLESALEQARGQQYPAYLALEEAKIDQSLLERRRALTNEALADSGPEDAALDAEIAVARAGFASTTIAAPQPGEVLLILARAGEVSSGTLMYLGDTARMRAVAEVDEADIAGIAVGDPAEVQILDQKVTGRVSRIGRMVAPNQMASLDPRARQDLRVIPVSIDLDDSSAAAAFVNMQVEVAINPQLDAAATPPPGR